MKMTDEIFKYQLSQQSFHRLHTYLSSALSGRGKALPRSVFVLF